jgi:hypothetical protein
MSRANPTLKTWAFECTDDLITFPSEEFRYVAPMLEGKKSGLSWVSFQIDQRGFHECTASLVGLDP